MSTILNQVSRTAQRNDFSTSLGVSAAQSMSAYVGAGWLTVMLMVAAVVTIVLFADQNENFATDGHLFFAWVSLWALVFAGMALFSGIASVMANSCTVVLARWSLSNAQSRTEARTREIAKRPPGVMFDLTRMRASMGAKTTNFDAALAPLGLEPMASEAAPETSGWERFAYRIAASRSQHIQLQYI